MNRIWLFLAVLLGPFWASDTWALELASATSGRIEVRDGKRNLATLSPRTAPELRGKPALREVQVAGHRVVEVRIPVQGKAREEVWVAELGITDARPIWWDLAGPLDADGETRMDISVSEAEIMEYQSAMRVSRCDGGPVRLFVRTWDFAERRFRATAPALAAPDAATPVIQARRDDPAMPTGRPADVFFWTIASTGATRRDVRALTTPVALNDGDPSTVWSGGPASLARGELLSARSAAPALVTGLRLVSGDASDERTFAAVGRPARMLLLLGPGADQRFEVELSEKDGGGPVAFRRPFWIPLPKPVRTSCVTLVVREVAGDPGGRPEMNFALSDIDVLTDLDGPQGLERLVNAMSAGDACEAKVPLAMSFGAAALPAIAGAVRRSSGAVRECLVEALVRLMATVPEAAGAPLVTEAISAALIGASRVEERLLLTAVARMPAPPVDALAALLANDRHDDADRVRAARALAELEQSAAKSHLLAAAGNGSTTVRSAVREILASAKPPLAAALCEAAAQTSADAVARKADLLYALGASAGREPAEQAVALEMLRAPFAGNASFELRARAIAGLGRLGTAESLDELTRIRSQSGDAVLRRLATRELAAAFSGDATLPALRQALADRDPQVRETAALALGTRRDRDSGGHLLKGASQEPWPFVRRANIAALGDLCVPGAGDVMVKALSKDFDEVRRAALIALVSCRDRRARSALLAVLGRRADDPNVRALAARLLGEMKDRTTTKEMLAALRRLIVDSQTEPALEGVAVSTVHALASIGGPEAVEAAVDLVTDPRSVMRQAAVGALGRLCDPARGAAALKNAARDPSVSDAAALAEHRCREVH